MVVKVLWLLLPKLATLDWLLYSASVRITWYMYLKGNACMYICAFKHPLFSDSLLLYMYCPWSAALSNFGLCSWYDRDLKDLVRHFHHWLCTNLPQDLTALVNSYSASHDNWCTATLWNRIMTAQCEGMGEVGSARYEPALLPPCPSIRVLCCQRSSQLSEIQ